jgi:hypothetical protein
MEKRSLNNSARYYLLAGLIVLAIFAGISSCKKSGDCFKSTGNIIQQSRSITDFDTILAKENVDIVLTQDSVNGVVVEAGEKIIDGITTVINNRQLEIDNTNSCNWVRSYDKPLIVYVHVKNLRKIWYLSAGNITTTNVLTPGSFMLDVWGGCGSINLSINVVQGVIYEHLGTADITVRGKSLYSSVSLGDFGFLQLKDLQSDYAYITSSGSNDCYINARKYLAANINSIGNIYYTGNPDSIHVNITGTGQLIQF